MSEEFTSPEDERQPENGSESSADSEQLLSIIHELRTRVAFLNCSISEMQNSRVAEGLPAHIYSGQPYPIRNIPYEDDLILPQERFEPINWSKSLTEQLDLIQNKYLSGFNIQVDQDYVSRRFGEQLDAGFTRVAIPKLETLARIHNLDEPYSRIGTLIEHVCNLLGEQREGKFTHYRKGQLNPNRVRVIPELIERRQSLEESIPGDVMILDVDMGNHYAGWTPRRARSNIIHAVDQLALSSVDIGWINLINPERFQRNTDLSVDSVMEEYLSEDRGWVTVLFYYYRGGKLEFGYRWNRRAYFDCGAVMAKIQY